jgi:hypothetical protein
MKVVLDRAVTPVERAVAAGALGAGHDVRIRCSGADLPRGCRPSGDLEGDVVVAVAGGLGGIGTEEWLALEDLVHGAAASGTSIVVVATSDVAAVERLLVESGSTWTMQACTTLHDDLAIAFAERPCTLGGDLLVQPVDAGEVAERVVRLLRLDGVGRVPDFGGPEVTTVGALASSWPSPVELAPDGRGGLGAWTAPHRAVGRVTWEAWLHGHSAADPSERGDEPVGTEPGRRRPRLVEHG